ncbi:precorrin methylase [Neorhizobium sp. P12A]|uniref:cobalamin biosynthesis protein n=1 Tax=Neorhizobium sp. P12A TaxID=2268027 RepID=UPI0011EBBA40|nr:cobalamin biosynthesis protein [Neorhizobium sp. P12A]KAA0700175.1 precorrin methylase [Neorhizobium sp. P12A]
MPEDRDVTNVGEPCHSDAESRPFVLGIGCERGAPIEHIRMLAEEALSSAGIGAGQVACLSSIDMKREEPAILALADYLEVPLRFFDAATLEKETPRLKNPSELVFARVGCHGVAEAAALAAAGPSAILVVPKLKSAFSTAAIAEIC